MNQDDTTIRNPYGDEDPDAESRAHNGQEPTARAGRRPAAVNRAAAETDESEYQEWEGRVSSRNAPRVEPRSERVKSSDGARARWWRPESMWGRALLALGAFAVVGGGVMAALLLHSALESDDRFRITGASNIETEGLVEVTRAELLPVFGEDIGKNIFFINLEARRREVEAIPWVKHATVMRMLPNRLRISIEERKPVAFTQINGETGLVDADGVLLTMPAMAMAERHYSFPDVSGLSSTAKLDERRARMNVYMQMMAELDAGGQHNSLQISEVDLSDVDDARVKMVEQGGDVVAHLGYERFLDRYQRYMKHIAEWRQQYPRLIGVDLRYKGQAVLKRAPAGTPLPGQPKDGVEKQPVQTANGKSPAQKPAVPGRQAVTSKAKPKGALPAAHGAGKQKQPAPHAANPHTATQHGGKAKADKQKTEQTRTDRSHTDKQRQREAARHSQMNTARHRTPAVRPAQPTAEGQ